MTVNSFSTALLASILASVSSFFCMDASAQANALDRVGLTSATPASPAYSLRKLSTAYSGKALQVRRSSDNALLDIGFTAGFDLDTTALKNFVGSGSGFVAKWYDQSGFAINAVQATTASQPRIVNSGVIDRLNGRPAIYFGTANLATAKQVIYTNAASMVGVAKGNSSTPSAFVTKTGTAAGANLNYPAPFDYTNNGSEFTVGNAATTVYNLINTASTTPVSAIRSTSAASVYSFVIPGTSGSFTNYVDGVQAGSQTINAFVDGGNSLVIGNRNDGSSSGNFWTPELILFNSALSNSNRNTLEAAQKSYYISDDATLTGLFTPYGYMLPDFTSTRLGYKAAVNSTSIVIYATTGNTASTIQYRVNGGAYTNLYSGVYSIAFAVAENTDNPIEIKVTSQSGVVKTYTINARKSNVLNALNLGDGLIGAPAYSLRKICAAYTGPALKVRRSTDNTTTDIGFTGSGDLDTIALKAFVGSGDGFADTWYDQSGLGVVVSQADLSLQPSIVNGGEIVRLGGRPSLYFGNSNMATTKQVLFPYSTSMSCVAMGNSGTSSTIAAKTGTENDSLLNFPAPFDYVNTQGHMMAGDPITGVLNQDGGNIGGVQADAFASVFAFNMQRNNGLFYSFKNGTIRGSSRLNGYRDAGNALRLGNRNDGGGSGNFWMPEIVFFNDNANGYYGTVEAAQKTYYTIPCPDILINAHPQNKVACASGTVSFNITATGTGINYQWRRGNVPVGINSATLTLSNIGYSDTGLYTCTVYNVCRETVSEVARLTIPSDGSTVPSPVISGFRSLCAGSATTFTASGGLNATYRWYTSATGGTQIFEGSIFNTPTLSATTHYYVTTVMCGFESARTDVLVLITPYTTLPQPVSVMASPASICQQSASALTAVVDTAAAQIVNWYDALTGGNLLGSSLSGVPYWVSPLATTTYYAQSEIQKYTATFAPSFSQQTFIVPEGVSELLVDARGGGGGRLGGNGGRVQTRLQVIPGQLLYISVGQGGWAASGGGSPSALGGGGYSGNYGGVGGGATDIRIGGNAFTDRVMVAGGGGGGYDQRNFAGYGSYGFGGAGGDLVANGGSGGAAGGGGTQTSGGSVQVVNLGYYSQPGGFGYGGASTGYGGVFAGGGGGGWYGGGGGVNAGGGGGSSYTDPNLCSNVTHTKGDTTAVSDGILKITYSTNSSCGSSTTRVPVTVTVRTRPEVTVPADFNSCAAFPVTLTATGADTYVWQPGNLSGPSITVAPGSTTTYTVVGALTSGGCLDTAQTIVHISALQFTGNTTICAGDIATLNVSGADTYTWQPGALSGASVQVSPTTTTTYSVTGFNNSGCQTTGSVQLTVNPVPTLSAGTDIVITPGTLVTLQGNTNADNTGWSPISGSGNTLTVLPAASTDYRFYGSFSTTGCFAEDMVHVTLLQVPVISGNTNICAGNTTQLTAAGTGPFTWYDAASGGNLLFTGTVFNTSVLDTSIVYWASDNGGPRIAVAVNVSRTVPLATPATICLGGASLLTVQNRGTASSWYDAAVGGNLLGTTGPGGSLGVTPLLTTTYYAQSNSAQITDTFYYTGAAQTFIVPAGVTTLQADLRGGRGGDLGGLGGRVQATLNVVPGQVLNLYAGGAGTSAPFSSGVGVTFNGGGAAQWAYSGSGGGGTDIRTGGTAITDRVLVAGGGGGGTFGYMGGGAGGGLTGGTPPDVSGYGQFTNGKPGTQTAGGNTGGGGGQPGSFGVGGSGIAGAGGGGWFGGGCAYYSSGGGGGGSSYSNPSLTQNVVHTQGYNNGDGMIIFTYQATCVSSLRVPVTVTVNTATPVSIAASADTTCNSVQLTATGGVSYIWSTPPRTTTARLIAGLHQINTNYNGPAIELRRPSDNVTSDFGFVNGELDMTTITLFLGSETGRCTKLFDQSGNGNHMVQTDTSRQPLFIASGINGRPVLRTTANPGRFMTSPINLAVPYTAIYLAKQTGPTRGRMLSSVSNNWLLGWHNGNKSMAYFEGWVSPSGGIPADSQIYLYSASRNGSTTRVFENSVQLYSNGNGPAGLNGLQINGYLGGPYELSDADFGDVLLFDTELSDAARAEAEGFTARYYGLATPTSSSTITVFPSGPATTYTVISTSANGCQAVASKTIVKDGKPPVIQCPVNQEIILNASCSATLPDYRSLLTVSDNCTPANGLVITQTPAAGTVINGMDTVQIQFTVRDSATFQSTCSIRVIPKDTTTLHLLCPTSQSVSQLISQCGAIVSIIAPVVSNCRSVLVQQTAGTPSGALFPVGNSLVTYTASDAAGNTNSCSFTITVIPLTYSVTGDTLVCQGGSTALTLANAPGGAPVNWYTQPNGGGVLAATGNPFASATPGSYYARYSAPCGTVEIPVTVSNFRDSLVITGDTVLCSGTRNYLVASGFLSNVWTGLRLPVDAAPAAARLAVGLRQLNSSYTGPIVRLRRASDSAMMDFSAQNGSLDTVAISAWSGGPVYCVTLYDQSGNARDITQPTVAAQPLLILRSPVNNRPALRFNTAQYMQLDAMFPAPFTISYTARQTGGARGRVLSTYRNNWLLGWHAGGQRKAYFEGWVSQAGTAPDNNIQVYTGNSDGSVSSFYENGVLIASNGGGRTGPDGLQLNGLGSGERSDCEFMEVLVYNSVLSETAQNDVEAGQLNYFVSPDRVLIAIPQTGQVRSYTAVGSRAACGTSATKTVIVHSQVQGDPTIFGNGLWNVFVWNNGGQLINANSWSSNYSGYYTATGLNFNTATQWASGTPPSTAAGYQGCLVNANNNSWSAKRQGFTCSRYRLSVTAHDDGAQLWINGIKVWEHDGCCDNHANVWEGKLGATDSVEFRVTQGFGGSNGAIQFTDLGYAVTLAYATSAVCASDVLPAPVVNQNGGIFTAVPAGLAMDAATGVVNLTASATGSYIITYSLFTPCDTMRATAPLHVSEVAGDPAVYGNAIWNVYAWNSGGSTINANTWNQNYVGYYTATGTSFNTTSQWPVNASPSSAATYQGCAVNAGSNSWSAKRKGFTCGVYRIDITGHSGAAQLWLNGVKVWEHTGCCDQHTGVWSGYINASDSLMFRETHSGSNAFGSISLVALPDEVSVSYDVSATCISTVSLAATVNRTGGVFSAIPAGLSINATTGLVQPVNSSPGVYDIIYSFVNQCGQTLTDTASLQISGVTGNPAVYGNGIWNVYVWNSGGALVTSDTWNLNYVGYYTASGMNFNTEAQWASGTAPSGAAGYQGCPAGAENNAWSAKRKGFPCGYYRIDVASHDDAAQLWVNGQKVWEHDICCDQHTGAWAGYLSETDSVDFRVTQGSGGSTGAINLVLLTDALTIQYNATAVCSSYAQLTPSINRIGGVFSAAPAGLSIDPVSGVIQPGGSATGNYMITYTVISVCGELFTATTNLSVSAASGNPSVYGAGVWNVYAWNSGFSPRPSINSWNLNYSGYYVANGLDFNTENQWASGTPPSAAPGYTGCGVNASGYSWSAKRKGFPCGLYRIDVASHKDGGQLWVNGVMVWSHIFCCDQHYGVWTGTLSATDSVEFRVTNGSGASFGAINLVQLGYDVDLTYPTENACSGDEVITATVNRNGGVFSSAPAGLSLDTSTGTILPSSSTTGSYTIFYSWTSPCGDIVVDSSHLTIRSAQGDPSQFGQNAWNVYVWNSGGATINSNAWNTNYSGFYTATGLDFSTLNQWADGAPPSDAPGYLGCAVGNNNHSWSAKRKGFTCGYYSINIDAHDDAAQLWINGVKVWEHNGCCDPHSNVWEGVLSTTDSVEFRVTQGGGGANGTISFHAAMPSINYGAGPYCASAGLLTPAIGLTGGLFTATPAGLSINASTGQVNTGASLSGIYTVTYRVANPCGDTLQSTASLTLNTPAGDPAVPGANTWNVYLWNAGQEDDPAHSWNTAYSGYIPGFTSVLSPNFFFIFGGPSDNPNYQGCPADESRYSWTAKRQGFPCGRYQLSFTSFQGTGELWINGTRVGVIGLNGTGFSSWQGYLSTTDIVELRVRSIADNGSIVRMRLINIGESVTFSYASRSCVIAGSSEILQPVITGGGGGAFSATPAGLSLDAATGAINLATSVVGDYTITYNGASVCGTPVSLSTGLTILPAAGNPSQYGQNAWFVYAWNAGNFSGTPWSSNYAGYYVDSSINVNTESRWDLNGSPSLASGFQGCPVDADNHSWSAKRQGFPCGYYQLNIPGHDDQVELWINGTRVFEHSSCCDSHTNVWRGKLGPADRIEFRAADGNGGSMGELQFVAIANPASISYAGTPFAAGPGTGLPTLAGDSSGTYSSTPGLSINAASGAINLLTSAAGTYTVTYTLGTAISCPDVSTTASVTIMPAASLLANRYYCANAHTDLIGFNYCSAGSIYTWTNSNPAIGLAASGTGALPSFTTVNNSNVPVSGVVTVSTANCAQQTFTITVNPTPNSPMLPNEELCAGTVVQGISLPAGLQYSWTNSAPGIGLAASGTGDIPSFIAQNNSGVFISAYVTVTSYYTGGGTGCPGKQSGFHIIVKPTPVVTVPENSSVCDGTAVSFAFTSQVPGTVFSWTSTNTASGLHAAGTGNIPSFMPLPVTVPQTATITVTPSASHCVGTPVGFSFTVNPGAGTIDYPGTPFCHNGWAYVHRTGSPGGVYSASPAGLVLDVANGAVNLALSASGIYTVSYTVAGGICANVATTTITVNSSTTVNAIGNQVFCADVQTAVIPFSGSATGFTWTNSNPAIGLAASGTGTSIPVFTTVNNTGVAANATITVTPLGSAGCAAGKPVSFRIQVSPRATVNVIANQVYCRGVLAAPVAFASNIVSGVTYTWSRTAGSIGLTAISGTGNIPGFNTVNATAQVVSSVVSVRATANKCIGPATSFTYMINNCMAMPGSGGSGSESAARAASFAAQVTLGPNPTAGHVTIYTAAKGGNYTVQVSDSYGRPVSRMLAFNGSSYVVDLTGLSAGIYTIQLVDKNDGSQVQKLVTKL
jgi:hypothetical protein